MKANEMRGYRVETYHLHTATGRHIRLATQVTCPNGRIIRFVDLIGSKREAIRNAQYQQAKGN